MQLPIDTDRLAAVFSGQVEPVMPWIEKDGRRQPGTEQERDEATGHPLWTVHCMIASGDRPTLMAVRVPSPEVPDVQQFGPARFERLECSTRVNRTNGQLATYWSAAGLVNAARPAKQHEAAA
ncbi:hypothetical protein [Actinomycetospora soli]|uniref:hypothetical protein n=1 Tax=Actinomycetospora soli TaxID=2893887 RepID=UPI001E57C14C|nr:hypothetical protein [Actinomycetospora soli]MCD2191724.1 hypothetical protein [Actinomycetospora soli]